MIRLKTITNSENITLFT